MTNKSAMQFRTSGTYCIQVQGVLNEDWADRMGGLEIRVQQKTDESAVTTLNGRLIDQAALMGVLNALYNMHYPLLLVEYLPDEGEK